jgi:hypothetical protein
MVLLLIEAGNAHGHGSGVFLIVFLFLGYQGTMGKCCDWYTPERQNRWAAFGI